MAKTETLTFRCPAHIKEFLIRDARKNDRRIQDSAINLLKRGIELVQKEERTLHAAQGVIIPEDLQ